MPRRLGGRYHMTQGQHAQESPTTVGFLLGVLGLLACVVSCTGPNPLVRTPPPDALAWDEARLADSSYFYQRFLTQYPTSAFARHARTRLEALEWAVVQQVDGVPDYARFIRAYPDSVWVPQAQARLTALEEQDARRQDLNARVNCPQLQDRVHAYATAVEQTLADMAQLPPDRRQRPRPEYDGLAASPNGVSCHPGLSKDHDRCASHLWYPPPLSPTPQRDRLLGFSDYRWQHAAPAYARVWSLAWGDALANRRRSIGVAHGRAWRVPGGKQ